MSKNLHRQTKKELINTVQDYQEMVSEIEAILNALLYFEHPLHTKSGLLDIREIMNRYLLKENIKVEQIDDDTDIREREDHQCA